MRYLLLLLFLTSLSSIAFSKEPINHTIWDKTPINFIVPVGDQRMLSFPSRVNFSNSNPVLNTANVEILNNNGTLYITAKKAFKPTLLPVHLDDTGKTVLIYVSGSKQAINNSSLDVVIKGISKSKYRATKLKKQAALSINEVSLTRYALQQLGNPRLAHHADNIFRSAMYTTKKVNIYPDAMVISHPSISWQANNLYVTAVLLENISANNIVLDPRLLQGYFLSASFYPTNVLTKLSSKSNQTWLIVTSNKPFGEATKDINPYAREII